MGTEFNQYLNKIGEIGFVEKVVASLVYVDGLPGARSQELVLFEAGGIGWVNSLYESRVEVLSFSKSTPGVGSRVVRTDRVLEIPVGQGLLGSIINPLVHSLDPARPVPVLSETRPVDIIPAGINARSRIKSPCETGVSLIDLMIPLGKGQRELVIGDQKTGKSRFLLRSLLTQVRQGSIGIYAVIGKSRVAIKQIESFISAAKVWDRCVIVAASADDPANLIFLTPYTAMTIAEYFRDEGQDVLLVLDDLSVHARAYREISLLGKRFPGRNSYPGDIFYVQARLLERAGNFKGPRGERAITCLPVAETVHGDLTGYIQTNLISMTDGHIFFDYKLFTEGRRPAVDPFLSVTRVGRQTKLGLRREIGSTLITFLKNAERVRTFVGFGEEAGEHIRRVIEKEKRIWYFLDQTAYDTVPGNLQILLFGLTWSDLWQNKTKEEIRQAIQRVILSYERRPESRRRVDDYVGSSRTLKELLERIGEFDFSTQN